MAQRCGVNSSLVETEQGSLLGLARPSDCDVVPYVRGSFAVAQGPQAASNLEVRGCHRKSHVHGTEPNTLRSSKGSLEVVWSCAARAARTPSHKGVWERELNCL